MLLSIANTKESCLCFTCLMRRVSTNDHYIIFHFYILIILMSLLSNLANLICRTMHIFLVLSRLCCVRIQCFSATCVTYHTVMEHNYHI